MFIRWKKRNRKSHAFGGGRGTDTHWAAILVESSRVDGKPTQQHIAYLGGITDSAIKLTTTAAQRGFFWQAAMQQLDQLADRVLKDDRARIEAALAEKVPRLTRKEYDTWLVQREGLGLDAYGAPPSFKISGEPETKKRKRLSR